MFVSACLFGDYRSERPTVPSRRLTPVRRGLSGTAVVGDDVLGRDAASAPKSTPTVDARCVVSPSDARGAVDATDRLAEIGAGEAGWASSACWCSNSVGER